MLNVTAPGCQSYSKESEHCVNMAKHRATLVVRGRSGEPFLGSEALMNSITASQLSDRHLKGLDRCFMRASIL